jgi:DNA-binding transcriptional LysR family regulator
MLDQLRALAVFAKVADLGSFRAAARALTLSPSVVSHHVAQLEAHVAVPLLYRSTRRLSLTSAGKRLLDEAQTMVAAAERGLDAVSGRSASQSGTLRLTAPAFFAQTSFAADLAAFAAAHPAMRIEASFTDTPRDLVREGIDVAIRIGSLRDSTHRTRRLASMQRVLVGAPRYVDAHPRPRSADQLRAWDFVHLSSRSPELVLTGPRGKASVRYEPRVTVDNVAAMRALVLGAAGIATLPEIVVRDELTRGILVEVLPRMRPVAMHAYAVWPQNAQKARSTLRFLEFFAPRLLHLFALPEGGHEAADGRSTASGRSRSSS